MKMNRRDMLRAAAAGIVLPQMLAGTRNVWGQQAGGAAKKAYALHIGVDQLKSSAYPGTPNLKGCVNDAQACLTITTNNKFTKRKLIPNSEATVANISKYIHWAAIDLNPGDLFVVTYSGHGSQLPSRFLEEQEGDGKDETWCLHDAQLRDDRKNWLYSHFKEGVRILEISDSCHSGTVARVNAAREAAMNDLFEDSRNLTNARSPQDSGNPTNGSTIRALLTELENKDLDKEHRDREIGARGVYDPSLPVDPTIYFEGNLELRARVLTDKQAKDAHAALQNDYDRNADRVSGDFGDLVSEKPVTASGLLLAGCQDTELSYESNGGGLFTRALMRTNEAGTARNYQDFLKSIGQKLNSQRPNFFPFGKPNDDFYLSQKPFTV